MVRTFFRLKELSEFTLHCNLSVKLTKIKPRTKIDNFAYKNSDIIIEGLI